MHTPGPWKADKDWMGHDTYGDGDSIPVFPESGGVSICDVTAVNGVGLSRPDIQATAEANARLIAQAPAMLEALELAYTGLIILPQDIKDRIPGNILPTIEAAIVQAKGA